MEIISNGSKFLGGEPDTLQQLLQVLRVETLDPGFEYHGNFFYALGGPDGWGDGRPGFTAFGNFWTCSHVFQLNGSHEELAELEKAIRANQETENYKHAKKIHLARKEQKVREFQAYMASKGR